MDFTIAEFGKKDQLETRIIYSGVIMAGDKLVISNNSGALLIASPIDGKVEKLFLLAKEFLILRRLSETKFTCIFWENMWLI